VPASAARPSRRSGMAGPLLALALALAAAAPATAQTGTTFNQRDDQYRLLGLKRAKSAYELARQELDRKEELFRGKLLSQEELDRARNALSDAEVNYQQSLLAVIFEEQWVTVLSAVKRQEPDGRKVVRLTLANASGGGEEFQQLVQVDDELFRSLQPDVIHDVYVALLNDRNVIVSQPYEAKIENLRHGHPVELEFQLLQDLDEVTVDLVYGNGTQRSPRIFLQKDASEDKVVVQSEGFSQEAELGGDATFDLTLELFSGATDTFRLEVVGLPDAIDRRFVDPATQARLRQFRFTDRTDTRRASLQVFLPDRLAESVPVDHPVRFFVLALPAGTPDPVAPAGGWTAEALDQLGVGHVMLELVPRGVGKLLVRAPQLFHSIAPDGSASLRIEVVNEGTRRLDNVAVEVDAPLRWDKSVEPREVAALAPGEEQVVQLAFTPPADVAAGRYEFRVRTTSLADSQPVRGEEKSVTVEVKPRPNLLATLALVGAIVLLVLGIVAFGIRLSRR